MDAKEYLSQARYIDVRINSKIHQLHELNDLATKATSVITGMPYSSNGNKARMANTVAKIVDLQTEINHDIDTLVDLKESIRARIENLPTRDLQSVIEMRYCDLMSWPQISVDLGLSLPTVYRLHDQALAAIEKELNPG